LRPQRLPAMWNYIEHIAIAPFVVLFSLDSPFSAPMLLGTALTALVWYLLRRRSTLRRRADAFLRVALSRRFWGHRSTWLDLKCFFASTFFTAAGLASVFAISFAASAATQWLLGLAIAPAPAAAASLTIALVMAAIYWVMYDLGYWFAHWLMHRIPVLWEFHKVHHSAEVLTPLTEWRQHPIELLLFPLCTGTTIGVLYGLAEHLLGMQRQGLSLFWINMLL